MVYVIIGYLSVSVLQPSGVLKVEGDDFNSLFRADKSSLSADSASSYIFVGNPFSSVEVLNYSKSAFNDSTGCKLDRSFGDLE